MLNNSLNQEYNYKCCFTGYRPSKFPFPFSDSNKEYRKFENDLLEEILNLCKCGCTEFYSGMAMGFDIVAAESVLLIKNIKDYKNIKLYSVIPFSAQSETYPDSWKKRYDNILKTCDEKIVLSNVYTKGCYQERNKFMVDNCDFVLTWYNGKPGGTRNTLNYALKKQRQIFNLYKEEISDFAVQTTFEIL